MSPAPPSGASARVHPARGDIDDVSAPAASPSAPSSSSAALLQHHQNHQRSSSSIDASPSASVHEKLSTFLSRSMTPCTYSVMRSTAPAPMGAPKAKHVHRLARASWAKPRAAGAANVAETLAALAKGNMLHPVVALKTLAIVHALMQFGSAECLSGVYCWRDHLEIILHIYATEEGELARERRRAHGEIVAANEDEEGLNVALDLVAPHAALLRAKAKFHRHFAQFENNYACDARLDDGDEDDIGVNDPISTTSLQALLAVVARARSVLSRAISCLPNAYDEIEPNVPKLGWLELVGFVAKLVLHECDLAYRAAVFVAACMADEQRLTTSDDEKFRIEHELLRSCFADASQKMILRQEFVLVENVGDVGGANPLVRLLDESPPNFFNTNKEEILSANAKPTRHALRPVFNFMDADGDVPAEEIGHPTPTIVAETSNVPPLIVFDDDDVRAPTPWENPVGWALPHRKPGHERKNSEFDIDAFTTPLEFTPLQSGPASESTYVDPFTTPSPNTVAGAQQQRTPLNNMDGLAQSMSHSPSPGSSASKPPRGGSSMSTFEEISVEDLDFGRQIGRGAFGEVFRGRYQGTDVAIKRLCVFENVSDERGLAEFKRELSFLTRLRHRHVVQFIGACTTPPNLCIVMDYCDKGSLYGYLHNPNKAVTPYKVCKWMSECAKGLTFLHSRDIIHRDIKSGNLLIDEGGSIKLGDFGLSRLHATTTSTGGMMSLVGTYPFMAPELLDGSQRQTTCIDVYSFGVVMWECLTRQEPFAGLSPMQIVAALIRGERPHVETGPGASSYVALPKEYVDLMCQCWSATPEARPRAADALEPLERMFHGEKRALIAAKQTLT